MTKPTKSIDLRLKEAQLKKWKLEAKREELEIRLKNIKSEEKLKNLCRIDVALDEFDKFLQDFVQTLMNFPDTVQRLVPSTNPDEYRAVQDFIDDTIQRLAQKRVYLAIESTQEIKDKATQKWYESMAKNQDND